MRVGDRVRVQVLLRQVSPNGRVVGEPRLTVQEGVVVALDETKGEVAVQFGVTVVRVPAASAEVLAPRPQPPAHDRLIPAGVSRPQSDPERLEAAREALKQERAEAAKRRARNDDGQKEQAQVPERDESRG